MPLEFFMLWITQRSSLATLPVISMWPTLTLGPSLTTKETLREEGGICSIWGSTVAYWRPRSARNSLSTTAARCTLLGAYCDSTLRPTLRSLKRSRISETVTLLAPGDSMERMTRRSVSAKRNDQAGAAGFRFQADIVEAAGVPQDHEIGAQRLFVVDIARLGNDEGLQGVLDRKS